MSKWIKATEDKRPKAGERVLVYWPSKDVMIMRWQRGWEKDSGTSGVERKTFIQLPTHWMELPSAPRESEK